jgi:sugar phosphate isomerase/epimerase
MLRIKYFHGLWGMSLPTLEANLRRIREAGFDGVEMGVPEEAGERRALGSLLGRLGLELIAQQWTVGSSSQPAIAAPEHATSFEQQYRRAAELRPLVVNSHTGKDYYGTEENLQVFQRARRLEEELGIPVVHEVHRGRATFSTLSTAALLDRFPELRLAADFSHWCCVHESLLQDQQPLLEKAMARSFHIHARVGHPEGPQVSDPRAPEWRSALEAHLGWWQKIVDYRRREGAELLTICPEFGPPDYMPTLPYTRQPVADLLQLNCHMKELLRERLRV